MFITLQTSSVPVALLCNRRLLDRISSVVLSNRRLLDRISSHESVVLSNRSLRNW